MIVYYNLIYLRFKEAGVSEKCVFERNSGHDSETEKGACQPSKVCFAASREIYANIINIFACHIIENQKYSYIFRKPSAKRIIWWVYGYAVYYDGIYFIDCEV